MSQPSVSAAAASPADVAVRVLLGLAVTLLLVAVFFLCLMPIPVTDFWWQAKTGELIVRGGGIPSRDPFSWTAPKAPWLVHEWLTEVFFYLSLAHLPHWTLLFYKGGLAALTAALILVRAWRRSGSLPLAIGVTLLAGFALRNYADLRPQMITFVLLAGLLLALDEYRDGRLRRLPWALPAVFALWANLHGGVVVGLILILLWISGEAVEAWLLPPSQSTPDPARVRRLALGGAACLLSVCLNPNGPHIYAYPFQVLGHPQVQDYITEWFSPNFHTGIMRAFEVMVLGVIASAAILRRGERRGLWISDLLVLLAMAHAAFIAQRNTAPFALAAAPIVAAGAAAFLQDLRLGSLRDVAALPVFRVLWSVSLCCLLGVVIAQHVPRGAPSTWFNRAVGMDRFPVDAVEWLKDDAWPGNLYNDYVWGGYLIWQLHPRRKVFIDGRAEVYYPNKVFDDEMKIHRTQPGWETALDNRKVDVVLTETGGALGNALRYNPRWQLAFTGKVESVFTRVKPRE